MPISFVGSVSGETGNLTLTGVQEGDVCILVQAVDGVSNSRPSGTVAWPQISGGSNNFQVTAVYAHTVTALEGAAGSVTDNLSWGGITASTTALMFAYRGVASINSTVVSQGAASTTVTYGSLTLNATDGTSMVVAIGYHRATNGALQTAPSGLTNRIHVLDATDQAAVHDGLRSSWSSTDVAIGGTASGWRAYVLELIAEAGGGPPSETGSGSLTTPSLTAPSGASTASTTASGSVATLTLSAPTGTSSTFVSVTATGALPTLTLSAPAAAAATVSVATGAPAALALTTPTGASATEITASGGFAPLSLSAPVGSAAVISSVTGVFAQILLTAPTGTSSTVVEVSATGQVSALALTEPFGNTAVSALLTGAFVEISLSAPSAKSGTGSLEELVYQLLANRQELDPVLGEFIIYDVDGITIKWRAKAWEDANATLPYKGGALTRIDKLELQ